MNRGSRPLALITVGGFVVVLVVLAILAGLGSYVTWKDPWNQIVASLPSCIGPSAIAAVAVGKAALDNAMMESFWGRLQVELLNRKSRKSRIELASAVHDFIELWRRCVRASSPAGRAKTPLPAREAARARRPRFSSRRPTRPAARLRRGT